MTSISGKPMRMSGAFSDCRGGGDAGAIVSSAAQARRARLPRLRARRSRGLSKPAKAAALILWAVLATAVILSARGLEHPQFASSVELVEVYATVTDAAGAPVTGLQVGDFELLEDGRAQTVQAFAAGDFPLSVALAVDHSASMSGSRLQRAVAAAQGFLSRLRAEDQVMVLGISSEVTVLSPLSTDRAAQARAIRALRPWSTTSLNDALVAGIGLIEAGRGRRGLIVVSDGEDRYSEASPADVLERARRAQVMVYPVALGKRAPALFAEVAVLTGGRSFHVQDADRLDRALADIARELRFQYLLGYAPAGQPETMTGQQRRWHSIQVRVRRDGLRVRARDGYYADPRRTAEPGPK